MAVSKSEMRAVTVLFVLSGGCGLTFEVLWMRSLTNLLGGTLYGTSAVLTAFMGGMALGSFAAGRLADSRGSPLRLYGCLEIGIGLSALLVPILLDRLTPLCKSLLLPLSEGGMLGLWPRFVASVLVLLLPTAMMGATLPVLSRLLATDRTEVGRAGGRLYAWNTIGAVAGTVATGLFFIRWLGISTTNSLAAALNVLIGGVALGMAARRSAWGRGSGGEPRGETEPARGSRPRHRRILVLVAISGFSALSYEVLWTRMLSLITFNTVFAFTAMLAAFLAGIAAGSYILARALKRGPDPWLWFGNLQLAIGSYALASPVLFAQLAERFYSYQNTIAVADTPWGSFLLRQSLLAEAILLVPTTLMGAAFPLACEIYARGTGKTAASVGGVYASNTLGAIAGSALSGLVLVPLVGLKGGLLTAALLNLTAAALSLAASRCWRRSPWRLALPAAALGALFVFLRTDAAFRARSLGEGVEIVFHSEDATGVVEVFERDGARWLVTNRLHAEGSNLPAEIYKMKKQGYQPLLLHPDPVSVIEIGLGTGIGFNPVTLDERVARAEMVEISPGVVEAAAYFAPASGNVLDHPKVELRIDDGRNYMLLTPRSYDLIVLGLFTPYRAGVGYLFSREFYVSCRDRLEPGGMVVHWLSLSQLSLESLRIVLRTFHSVFPHVYVWDKGYFVGLVGREEPLRVDVAALKRTLGSPSMRQDLDLWQLDDPYNYLASFMMGTAEIEDFSRRAPLNTEDWPRIEFSDVKPFRAAYTPVYAAANLAALLEYRQPPTAVLTGLSEEDDRELARYYRAREYSLRGLVHEGRGELQDAAESFNRALELNPRDDIAWFEIVKYLR